MNKVSFLNIIGDEEDLAAKWIKRLKESKKKIVLMPAGPVAKLTKAILQHNGIYINAFCDNSADKIGSQIDGVRVISFEELKKFRDIFVINCSNNYNFEIQQQLLAAGFAEDNICNADFNQYDKPNSYRNFLLANSSKFQQVYDACADTISKQVFVAMVRYRLTGNRKYSQAVRSNQEQYFDSLVKLGEKVVFVDCGAYTGDTIASFIRKCPTYNRIYAFEPDPVNFLRLTENYKENKKITCINAGLGDAPRTAAFEGGLGGSSCVTSEGSSLINIVTLDDVVQDVPTFVKMDIEGSEKSALKGAATLIKRFAPKMAICVYHRREDIVDIPLFVLSLVPEYKLYFRHYGNFLSETVSYFVKDC